jgi:hypothetical protein
VETSGSQSGLASSLKADSESLTRYQDSAPIAEFQVRLFGLEPGQAEVSLRIPDDSPLNSSLFESPAETVIDIMASLNDATCRELGAYLEELAESWAKRATRRAE